MRRASCLPFEKVTLPARAGSGKQNHATYLLPPFPFVTFRAFSWQSLPNFLPNGQGNPKHQRCELPQPRASPWVKKVRKHPRPEGQPYERDPQKKRNLPLSLSLNSYPAPSGLEFVGTTQNPGRCPGLWDRVAFSPFRMSALTGSQPKKLSRPKEDRLARSDSREAGSPVGEIKHRHLSRPFRAFSRPYIPSTKIKLLARSLLFLMVARKKLFRYGTKSGALCAQYLERFDG